MKNQAKAIAFIWVLSDELERFLLQGRMKNQAKSSAFICVQNDVLESLCLQGHFCECRIAEKD